jgi:uncharacterized membrane protein
MVSTIWVVDRNDPREIGDPVRRFSVRPTLTLRGRTFKGLRGWSGKPAHPPLTDIPIAAYLFAAAFDVIATFGQEESWAQGFYRAGTYVLIGGAAVSVLTALTGFWDWLRSTEKGTQARRTANAHAWTMVTVTVLVLVNIALRLSEYDRAYPTTANLVLSLVVAAFVVLGAALGGTLVFDYGFNVETAGDSPVWHRSESDVVPGDHADEASAPTERVDGVAS